MPDRRTTVERTPEHGGQPTLLPGEVLRKVRLIEIGTRRLVNSVLAGQYHSAFKGQGVEFAEVREYVPGDDVRSIDWNVTARTGAPHVKIYSEERELTVMLAVDISGSSAFGSARQLKREVATEIAALLAFSALRNNDRVGLMLFSEEPELYVPPKKGRGHGLRVIRELVTAQARGKGTNIGAGLSQLQQLLHRRAVIFVISDFLDAGDCERSLRSLALRHDVICLRMTDRREAEIPDVGLIELEDPETGETLLVDSSSRAFQLEFAKARAERDRRVGQLARNAGAELARIDAASEYDRELVALFRRRRRRRNR